MVRSMKNQVLSIDQMQYLKELGIDTNKASMCWVKIVDRGFPKLKGSCYLTLFNSDYQSNDSYEFTPVFTLIDIIYILPKYIYTHDVKFHLDISTKGECNPIWFVSYRADSEIIHTTYSKNVIDAVYEMLCWAVDNGYIKQQIESEIMN